MLSRNERWVVDPEQRTADELEVVAAVLDYFEGWFAGDASRVERTLHPAPPNE